MLTMGIDSSAAAASAAVVEDGRLLGEFYCNTKQTHSQTLLPMVQELLGTVGRSCRIWTRWRSLTVQDPLREFALELPV